MEGDAAEVVEGGPEGAEGHGGHEGEQPKGAATGEGVSGGGALSGAAIEEAVEEIDDPDGGSEHGVVDGGEAGTGHGGEDGEPGQGHGDGVEGEPVDPLPPGRVGRRERGRLGHGAGESASEVALQDPLEGRAFRALGW